jgi:hypothetical protein
MEQEKRKKITAGGIAGFAIAFIVSFFVVSYFTRGGDDYSTLLKTSEEMNKSFPMTVDNDTRLDSTNVQKEPLTLNYYYTIVTVEKEAIAANLREVVAQLKKGTQDNLDKAPEMKEFREKNISLKYSYYDKKGVFVVDYTIKPTKQ